LCKVLNDHGRDPKDPEAKMFWMRNFGYKYKMSNMEAAMGLAQTERAEELITRKREIYALYKKLMADIPGHINAEQSYVKNSCWLPTFVFDKSINFDRNEFFKFMSSKNINSRPFFYPLSSLPMFEKKPDNTVSYDIYYRAINLPSYHDLTDAEIEYVVANLKDFLKKSN
jgi:perosamine synthetase